MGKQQQAKAKTTEPEAPTEQEEPEATVEPGDRAHDPFAPAGDTPATEKELEEVL